MPRMAEPHVLSALRSKYAELDGELRQIEQRAILSIVIAGRRIKVVQSTALTPPAANAMLKLLSDVKPSEIDDEGEAASVRITPHFCSQSRNRESPTGLVAFAT
jgi:hypothetical protein